MRDVGHSPPPKDSRATSFNAMTELHKPHASMAGMIMMLMITAVERFSQILHGCIFLIF
jgi:hypothetical protein